MLRLTDILSFYFLLLKYFLSMSYFDRVNDTSDYKNQ